MTIEIPPNSTAVTIVPFDNDRTTMEELNLLKRLVHQLINNLARQDLLNQARAAATTANFLNIFTEEFRTLERADLTYNAGGVVFDATVDIDAETGELTLPFTQLLQLLTRVPPQAAPEVRIGTAFYTLPYTPELGPRLGKIRLSIPPLWASVEGVEVIVEDASEIEVGQVSETRHGPTSRIPTPRARPPTRSAGRPAARQGVMPCTDDVRALRIAGS